MDAQRWRQIDKVLQSMMELSLEEQASFLDQACDGDIAMRKEVEALLAAYQQADSFIESPAFDDFDLEEIANNFANSANTKNIENGEESIDLAATFPVKDWHRYEFIELLGAGGMGRVYKARDLRLNRFVALKFLNSATAFMIKRFMKEAQAQAKIDHDNICKVYEVGQVHDHYYIAMQYIEGITLKKAKVQLSLREKVKLIRAVAEALYTAHQIGLIHRDIKPANILLHEGCVKLADFGFARYE